MKLKLPGADRGDQPPRQPASRFVRVPGPVPKAQALRHKLGIAVLGLCLLCGPASCMAVRAGAGARTPAPSEATTSTTTSQTQVEAAAVSFVRQWMVTSTKTTDALYSRMVTAPSQAIFPQEAPKPATVVEPAAVQATSQDGTWIVTVHAQGGSAGAGEWYSVPVQAVTSKNGVVQTGILALPARAAEPGAIARRGVPAQRESISANDPAVVTAVGFLTAWLTQSSTVDRWTDPAFKPAAISTQPCQSVRLLSASASEEDAKELVALAMPGSATPPVGEGQPSDSPSPTVSGAQVHLQIVATCTTQQAARPSAYTVALTQNSGRWAVKSVS